MTSPSPPTISFDDSGFDGASSSKPLLPKLHLLRKSSQLKRRKTVTNLLVINLLMVIRSQMM